MKRMRLLAAAVAGVAALTAVIGSQTASAQTTTLGYTLKTLAAPGASATFAVGVSSAGLIAGTYQVGSTTTSYTYDTSSKTKPTFVPFTVPPAHGGTVTDTTIAAISLHGDIAGNYSEIVGGRSTTYGFLYSGGTYTTFEFPGSVQTEVTAVSSQGTYVAGTYATPGVQHAFVYRPAAKVHYKEITGSGLGDYYGLQPQTINNSGFVTGSYFSVDRDQNRSFTTTAQTALDYNPLPKESACGITGANPDGKILVGFCYSPLQGLVQSDGKAKLYSAPVESSTILGAVSVKSIAAGVAQGVVDIVFSTDGTNVVYTFYPSTWSDVSVTGINSASKIVGRFTDSDSKIKVFWAH